jgi:signal transduction histidine kinase
MSSTIRTRPSAQLIGLIAAVTVVPLITLLWVGWRLFEQDRVLEHQQVRQRVERGADLLVAALQRSIATSEQEIGGGASDMPPGGVAVTFRDDVIEALPPGRVAYLPRVRSLREAPADAFARGEALEFQQQDLNGAVTLFREQTHTVDPAIRTGAWLRLARTFQKARRTDEALDAYAQVTGIDDVTVEGVPAALAARYARCKLFETHNRADDLHSEAGALDAALHSGRWPLTAPVYWLYSADAAKWSGADPGRWRNEESLAAAIVAFWEEWRLAPPHAASGRESIDVDGISMAVAWQRVNGALRALVAGPRFVESQWLSSASAIVTETQTTFALRDGNGKRIFGGVDTTVGETVSRNPPDTDLPWTLVVASVQPPREAHDFAVRRRFLVAGFVLLALMALAAGYLIVRAVNREVAVARLQSDFVSAVSHEFRTPLTSLRQFTEMLRENPRLDDERRRFAYDAQARATERLMRLVESLLDFGRMQAGARRYRFEAHDGADLVRAVVEDFRREAMAGGHAMEFSSNGSAPIDVDEEALSRAIRNLLDNAVKYSPDPRPIEVGVGRRAGEVRISVSDHGIGIPPHEHPALFSKFHRGEQARTRGIKGTGIGLAMVDEIVRAHQGCIEVTSQPGKGSTFTIVLPVRT